MQSLGNVLTQLENEKLVRHLVEEDWAYVFNHALTQETAYESLLKSKRRRIHQQIAEIFEQLYAHDLDGYASLLAFHYTEAGDTAKAIDYLKLSGEQALKMGALVEALGAFQRAWAMTPETDRTDRAILSAHIGSVYERQGEYAAAATWLRTAYDLAHEIGDRRTVALALSELSHVAGSQGDYATARQAGMDALAEAQAIGDQAAAALALRMLGIVANYEGENETAIKNCLASLELYRQIDDRHGINTCLNSLGVIAFSQNDFDSATHYFEQALELSRELGDQYSIGIRLENLGNVAGARKQFNAAKRYFSEAFAIARAIGSKEDVATSVFNLGDIAAMEGDAQTAHAYYRDALAQSTTIGALPLTLSALIGIAALEAKSGQTLLAAETLGFVLNHPSISAEIRAYADSTFDLLRAAMSDADLDAAFKWGSEQSLQDVMKKWSKD